MNSLEYFRNIKTFVLDMDGVLSDGKLAVMSGTEWIRNMHIRDGFALQRAIEKGYLIIIISGSESGPVKKRLHLLGIKDVFMSVPNKKERLEKCVRKYKLDLSEVLFMGDDIPDYQCLQMVGLPTCPQDAINEVKNISKYISPLKGGEGCVRDVIEKVLKLNGQWDLN